MSFINIIIINNNNNNIVIIAMINAATVSQKKSWRWMFHVSRINEMKQRLVCCSFKCIKSKQLMSVFVSIYFCPDRSIILTLLTCWPLNVVGVELDHVTSVKASPWFYSPPGVSSLPECPIKRDCLPGIVGADRLVTCLAMQRRRKDNPADQTEPVWGQILLRCVIRFCRTILAGRPDAIRRAERWPQSFNQCYLYLSSEIYPAAPQQTDSFLP